MSRERLFRLFACDFLFVIPATFRLEVTLVLFFHFLEGDVDKFPLPNINMSRPLDLVNFACCTT